MDDGQAFYQGQSLGIDAVAAHRCDQAVACAKTPSRALLEAQRRVPS